MLGWSLLFNTACVATHQTTCYIEQKETTFAVLSLILLFMCVVIGTVPTRSVVIEVFVVGLFES